VSLEKLNCCRELLSVLLIFYFSFSFVLNLQSPVDGKPMLLTPEESIHIQVHHFLNNLWKVIKYRE
jgi:queuine/archaeosine tRNA-ribosyltransferase